MVVQGRLEWITSQLMKGRAARLGVTTNGTRTNIHVVLQPATGTPVDNRVAIGALNSFLQHLPELVAVDHGHQKSNGTSYISIKGRVRCSPAAANNPELEMAPLQQDPSSSGNERMEDMTVEEVKENDKVSEHDDDLKDNAANDTCNAAHPPRNNPTMAVATAEGAAPSAAKDPPTRGDNRTGDEDAGKNEELEPEVQVDEQGSDCLNNAQPTATETENNPAVAEGSGSSHEESSSSMGGEVDSNQQRLQAATATADALADQIVLLHETIAEKETSFPPQRLEVGRLRREMEELQQRHEAVMAEVMHWEEAVAEEAHGG